MITDIIRNGFSLYTIINLLTRVFIIFCVLPIHEYAHALLATKMGDQTARLSGRLTINPLAHIDPIGALMIVFAGFGYAKPVPVNIRNFKNRKQGMAITAAAGPVSNIVMAFFSVIVWLLVMKIPSQTTLMLVTGYFFYFNAVININLAVFNLLPVPPLDGSRIAAVVLPDRIYYKIMQYERYIMIAVLLLLVSGGLTRPLVFLSGKILDLFVWIIRLVIH